MAAEAFEQIWQKLERDAKGVNFPGILTLRVLHESSFNFFVGIQLPRKIRILLIRISRERVLNQQLFPRSKGFEIRQTVLPEDEDQSITLQLLPTDSRFQGIFSKLAEDVVTSCACEPSESAMLRALLLRLEMWQQFMDRYGPDGLSGPQQRGLYGELRFLHDYLIPLMGPGAAVTSWTGPQRKPQDFHIAGMAVEVKTGIAGQHQKIQISGEQQLDDIGLKGLYLYHLSLREIREGDRTLPNLIDTIRGKLQGEIEASGTFEGLLFQAGYLDNQRELYLDVSYADRSAHFFQVTDGFPRIIERDLIGGVGDVRYSVNLASCGPYEVKSETILAIIEGIAHE